MDDATMTPQQKRQNKLQLGQLAHNRLTILAALKAEVNQDSLKEQLREIEKQMVKLGWDGRAHIVQKVRDGFIIKSGPEDGEGKIIRVSPFKVGAHVNKYI